MRKLHANYFLVKTVLAFVFFASISIAGYLDENDTSLESLKGIASSPQTSPKLSSALMHLIEKFSLDDEKPSLPKIIAISELVDLKDDQEIIETVLAHPQIYNAYLTPSYFAVTDPSQLKSYQIKRHPCYTGGTLTIDLYLVNGEKRGYHFYPPRYSWTCS